MTAPVLLIEDANAVLSVCGPVLSRAGYTVHNARTAAEGYRAFHDLRPGVVLLDPVLPDGDGLALLRDCRQRDARARFLVVPDTTTACRGDEALRAGADEVMVPPVDLGRLVSAVASALSGTPDGMRKPAAAARIVGNSPAMRELRKRLRAAARSSAPVFLTGETGTGKTLCARALHEGSDRADAPFVALDCAALDVRTLDRALANAPERRHGAPAGTLFLDEIDALEPAAQARLLALLRDRDDQAAAPGLRIVCAASRDPAGSGPGRLRPDLFYRLHVVPLALPPLRARGDDAAEIAVQALPELCSVEGRRFTRLAPETLQRLLAHDWPGNVRQLLGALRAAIVLHDGTVVEPHMLPFAPAMPAPPAQPCAASAIEPPQERMIGKPLAEIEKMVIEATIRREDGSLPRAARILGVSPSTLYRKREGWHRPSDA